MSKALCGLTTSKLVLVGPDVKTKIRQGNDPALRILRPVFGSIPALTRDMLTFSSKSRILPSRDDGSASKVPELLPGTLDLLVLRALVPGPMHGYGIAYRLKQVSDDVLQVGESSLYPALQRLLLNGWVKAEWGTSENNRRARFYTLTAAGRKQLAAEREEFTRVIEAIEKVLNMA